MTARIFILADAMAERARDCRMAALVAPKPEADSLRAYARRLECASGYARAGIRIIHQQEHPSCPT